MSIYSYPYESHLLNDGSYDRAISAEEERMFNKLRYTNGVFNNINDSLMVTAGNGMSVVVGIGGCHIEGALTYNTSPITLQLDASDSQLNRIDRIVAQFNLSDNVRFTNFVVKKGTLSTNPVAPARMTEPNIYELVLADIYIAKGVSAIATNAITDQRLNSSLCGSVIPAIPTPLDLDGIYTQYQSSLDDFMGIVESALNQTTAGQLLTRIQGVESQLAGKQAKLIEGENITISGNTISAKGNSNVNISTSIPSPSEGAEGDVWLVID